MLADASKCTIWPTAGARSSTESIAVGPVGVAAATARRLNATAHTADASPARCRRDTFAPLRPTRARCDSASKMVSRATFLGGNQYQCCYFSHASSAKIRFQDDE